MNEDFELQEVLSFKVKDSDLSFLNGMVNKADFGIGITLFVK
ncbi:TPA: gas vesicle protein, partial [Klebsiella michiganensis]|nr:gas vesicle protein [Klebsiella michiganensis]